MKMVLLRDDDDNVDEDENRPDYDHMVILVRIKFILTIRTFSPEGVQNEYQKTKPNKWLS